MTKQNITYRIVPRLACPTVSSSLRVIDEKEHDRTSRPWHRGILFLLWGLLAVSGCVCKEQLYFAAPTALPNVRQEMKSPGFWIGRHLCPDKVILSSGEIEKLNFHIQNDLKLTKDITRLAGPKRYGLVVHFADQRLAPTTVGKYKIPGDLDFDDLQNSGLDVGTPVVVTKQSTDGEWVLTESELSDGWVEARKIVCCSESEWKEFLRPGPFVVVTKAKADIFLNESLTEFYDSVRMGVRLTACKQINSEILSAVIPFKNTNGTFAKKVVYLRRADVHEGFLPYTPRQIIRQAFELLNAPYGWGDMHGEQDCSRFIQEIFATVGISMPRNSSEQAQVGRLVGKFDLKTKDEDKLRVLTREAVGGVTVLQLKRQNHIVLFLGWSDGRPYAIHATWGYRQKDGIFETVRVINRVAVTDLFLGEGASSGSLVGRTVVIRNIQKP